MSSAVVVTVVEEASVSREILGGIRSILKGASGKHTRERSILRCRTDHEVKMPTAVHLPASVLVVEPSLSFY